MDAIEVTDQAQAPLTTDLHQNADSEIAYSLLSFSELETGTHDVNLAERFRIGPLG